MSMTDEQRTYDNRPAPRACLKCAHVYRQLDTHLGCRKEPNAEPTPERAAIRRWLQVDGIGEQCPGFEAG